MTTVTKWEPQPGEQVIVRDWNRFELGIVGKVTPVYVWMAKEARTFNQRYERGHTYRYTEELWAQIKELLTAEREENVRHNDAIMGIRQQTDALLVDVATA